MPDVTLAAGPASFEVVSLRTDKADKDDFVIGLVYVSATARIGVGSFAPVPAPP